MKKITFCLCVLTFLSFTFQVSAQFSEGFESGIPVSWTIINNGDANGWTQNAAPSGGAFEGTSVATILYDSNVAHDDYLITPQIAVSIGVNDRISYYIKSRSGSYLEPFEVLLSTGGTAAVDFSVVLQASTEAPNAWTQYVFDLSAYDGQSVYIAIHATGLDEWELYVDNVVNDAYPTDSMDWNNLQWPASGTVQVDNPSFTVYAQCWESGLTDANSTPAPGIEAWIGYSSSDTDPSGSGWTWIAAIPNPAYDFNLNNDEYQADLGAAIANPGTYYYASRWRLNGGTFTYGGFSGGFWDGVSNVSGVLTIEPIANDDFANAIALSCDDNVTGDTTLATLDEDDAPDGFGADMDAPNVWYSYDSATEGAADVTVSLCGSSYDTSILVYTGTSGNLTAVAGNDDNDACGAFSLQSQATFSADGVQTYYIAVEGYNSGSVGAFALAVTCVAVVPPPANDECVNAEVLTLGNVVSGTTIGATQNGAEEQPNCDLFGTIADVWYSFTITGNSDVSIITTITGTSDQANVAVYSACGGLQADQVSCSDDNGGETVSLNGLASGTYYIRVWSDGNSARDSQRTEGTFDIVVDATLSTDNLDNQDLFSFYPNPVNNTLNIKAQKNIESVVVYNVLGQEVLRTVPNTMNLELDTTTLTNGSYFVKVTAEGISKTVRIIKQ